MNTKKISWAQLREKVFCKHLARDDGKNFQIDIIKLEPKITFAEHVHPDVEWVYVLKGSFLDENGTYNVGDFVVNPKGSKHVVVSGLDGCEILC